MVYFSYCIMILALGLIPRSTAWRTRSLLGSRSFRSSFVVMSNTEKSSTVSELVAYRGKDSHLINALQLLSKKRGCIIYPETHGIQTDETMITWSMHRKRLQLDCTILEPLFLGKRQLTVEDTARVWDEILTSRNILLNRYSKLEQEEEVPNAPTDGTSLPGKNKKETFIGVNLGDGGRLQSELNTALAAVQKASFMSRSLQRSLLYGGSNGNNNKVSISKDDKSPVTIADFAVQALVIHSLSQAFPQDKFIAEEDSELLRSDVAIREGVLTALKSVAPIVPWTEELLYSTIDKGMFDGSAPRVWVLDPVDGNTCNTWHHITSYRNLPYHLPSFHILSICKHLTHLLSPRMLSISIYPTPSPLFLLFYCPSIATVLYQVPKGSCVVNIIALLWPF